MKRVLVTGSSGFVGTNLIEALMGSGYDVLGVDIARPQIASHEKSFRCVDILDEDALNHVFDDFAPEGVVHLAARADLHEKRDLVGYAANMQGVANVIACVSRQRSVGRAIFTSTKLVCTTDYYAKSEDDYCPTTLYGESKVIGEKMVRDSTVLKCPWCIVRPTSIWGPWSNSPHIPYCRFFRMIAKGRYFHPGRVSPPKSFGYVGNTRFQIKALLEAVPDDIHRRVFYLSDYEVFTIREWADMISLRLRGRPARVLPEALIRVAAWTGDCLKACGIAEPPFSSFRLRNMRANTASIPLEPIQRITGPLPYTLAQGVDETIAWLRGRELIR